MEELKKLTIQSLTSELDSDTINPDTIDVLQRLLNVVCNFSK